VALGCHRAIVQWPVDPGCLRYIYRGLLWPSCFTGLSLIRHDTGPY